MSLRLPWIVLRASGHPLGEVLADNKREATDEAKRLWGDAVDVVQSRLSWEISQEELGIPKRRRTWDDEDSDESDCA